MRTVQAPILLLTACVNPDGMAYTALQDPAVRMDQYVNALRYYIDNTDLKIVVCENTCSDFSGQFAKEKSIGRLEYLTFDGNGYDRSLGKGYGEALIMQYALLHSQTIRQSDGYVVKVTGRIIVENIQEIIRKASARGKSRFGCNITETFFFQSVVMVFHKGYFENVITRTLRIVNDSATPPRYLEMVLAELIGKDRSIKIIPFLTPLILKGVSATYNTPYSNRNPRDNACDNLAHLSRILEARGQWIQSFICKTQYLLLLAKHKFLE